MTRYQSRVLLTDVVVIVASAWISQLLWVPERIPLLIGDQTSPMALSYTWLSTFLVLLWLLVMQTVGTRNHRIIGVGNTEYRRVIQSAILTFALVAILGYLTKTEFGRLYVLGFFVTAIILLILSRWCWRKWLGSQRARGQMCDVAYLVGSTEAVQQISDELLRHPEAGFQIAGTFVLNSGSPEVQELKQELPILLSFEQSGASHLVLCSSDSLSPEAIKEISWALDPKRHELIVAPSIIGVGGPRIHSRPVAGLPLIHIETPDFANSGSLTKRLFDFIGSLLILILISPVLLVVACMVKFTSAGPVFYKQERVGLDGKPFHMLKFRSMRVNADAQLAELLKSQGKGDQPFFKLEQDPRITPIGHFLRKHSLDEFPQLINVLTGTMSLVGPRPQRPAEVELYDSVAARRLLVKPGMTGLWQVSGRSTLTWEESIRLDLYYVENWTMAVDLQILARTVNAVLRPGASAV